MSLTVGQAESGAGDGCGGPYKAASWAATDRIGRVASAQYAETAFPGSLACAAAAISDDEVST